MTKLCAFLNISNSLREAKQQQSEKKTPLDWLQNQERISNSPDGMNFVILAGKWFT
jgi:hypothetical protein